jgi:transcriptional regulator with XRE-family HTH domain
MNAKLLKMLRQLNDISQYELADKLGCSRGLIALTETERQPISRKLERRITETFGTEQIDRVRQAMRVFEGDSDADD